MTRHEARERISGNVNLLMEKRKLKPNELSEMSGFAQSRLTLLLRGELLPNPADLWNVAEALGTTLDGLMKPVKEMACV